MHSRPPLLQLGAVDPCRLPVVENPAIGAPLLRIAAARLSGLLLAVSPAAYAADVGLNLEDGKFSPETVKMRLGDKLAVANRTSKN